MVFECSCNVCVDDYAEMIESRINKARKQHKCHECGSEIKVGEFYLVEKEKYDGIFSTHKTCLACKEIRNAYFSKGFYWGQIWEDLRECFEDIPLSDFDKFSPLAQQKILEKL